MDQREREWSNGRTIAKERKDSIHKIHIASQHMSTSQVNMPESAGCPHCMVGQLWHVFCLGWSRKLCGHLSHFSQYSQARAFPSFTTAFGAIWPRTPIIPPAISKEIWYLVISCRVTKQLWIGPAWSGLTISVHKQQTSCSTVRSSRPQPTILLLARWVQCSFCSVILRAKHTHQQPIFNLKLRDQQTAVEVCY